ncbi:MAG: hypothetical protein GF311_24245 [Candidatus Lokiarchaeota archaeon]|nr:hypothetical protein [Candidatus Lokiarchaeota archaeon]
MKITPDQIYDRYIKKEQSKEITIQKLLSIIESSDKTSERINGLHVLGKLGLRNNQIYDTLENILISDENEKLRIESIKVISFLFEERAIKPLIWVFYHERRVNCLILIISILTQFDNSSVLEFMKKTIRSIEMEEFQDSIHFLYQKIKNNIYNLKHIGELIKSYLIITRLKKVLGPIRFEIENGFIIKLEFPFINSESFSWNLVRNVEDSLKEITNLQQLQLKLNKIKRFPGFITRFSLLEILDLSNNSIKIIPESISNLRSLKMLNMEHNSLKTLPKLIGDLEKLEYLNLRHNQLYYLPESFKLLKNLNYLDLHGNKFNRVPYSIISLNSLNYLSLGLNTIKFIDQKIINLEALKTLKLGGNRLNYYTFNGLSQIRSLKELDLYDNNLKSIPSSLLDIQSLERLSLHNNQLEKLPENFRKLINLKELDISWNNFLDFPEVIIKLKNLEILNLSGNRIEKIPDSITELNQLHQLNLRFNNIRIPNRKFKDIKKLGVQIII